MPITNTTTARVGLDDGNGNGNGNSGCGRTAYFYVVILFLMSGIIGYRLLLFQDSVQNKEMSMSISSSVSTLASSSNSSSSSSFSSNTTDATSSSNTYPVDHNNDDDDDDVTATTSSSSMTVKQQQIENYKKGTGLMINVHMTHHGGTTFCGAIGMNGRQGRNYTPSFACMGDPHHVLPVPLPAWPWPYNQTEEYVHLLRPYVHMVSWEYGKALTKQRLRNMTTNWDSPFVTSVVIMRDPISRLMAGDGKIGKLYPGHNDGTLSHEGWWKYATTEHYNVDNFFLRLFIQQYTKRNNNKNKNNNRKDTTTLDKLSRLVKTDASTNNITHDGRRDLQPNNCDDDATYYFRDNTNRTCATIAKEEDKERVKVCGRVDTTKNPTNPLRVEHYCPKTCNSCTEELPSKNHNSNNSSSRSKSSSRSNFTMEEVPPSILEPITEQDYNTAVALLQRFTYVLDIQCLNEGMVELAQQLQLNTTQVRASIGSKKSNKKKEKSISRHSQSNLERIGYEDVYDYLLQKNYWDIKLYEYSKSMSIVNCSGTMYTGR